MSDFERINAKRAGKIVETIHLIEKSGRSNSATPEEYWRVLGEAALMIDNLSGGRQPEPAPTEQVTAGDPGWPVVKQAVDAMSPESKCDVLHYTALQLQNDICGN